MSKPFAIRVPKHLQNRFRAKFKDMPREKTQADLFRDMLNCHDIMSRDPLSTPSQTAPIAPRQAAKRPARVREGGAK